MRCCSPGSAGAECRSRRFAPTSTSGRLVRLNLRNWRGGEYDLQAVHKIDTPPGPAGRWLIERLVTLSDFSEAVRS